MDERIGRLLEKAFRVVPAPEANRAIAHARRERAGGNPDDEDGPALRSYEIVLGSWDVFAGDQLPHLVYHLESVGAHLPGCKGVIISAFTGDRLHFVDAGEFVAAAARELGMSTDALVERFGTGERRTAQGAPVLLPGPGPEPGAGPKN